MGAEERRERWGEATARRMLQEWEESDQSLAGFARERGVGVERLSYWRKRLAEVRANGGEEKGQEAFAAAVVTRSAGGISVRLACGVEVDASSTDALPTSWLCRLVRELRST